jgi:hypothetical protein
MIKLKITLKSTFLNFLAASLVLFLSFSLPGSGQSDSLKKVLKNTIRVNITNPMLFGSEVNILGYERVIKPHQTASISIGRIGFPTFLGIDFDSLNVAGQQHDKGFNVSVDYRFYLKKENKYVAPRGIYLGPYYAFNRFSRELAWDIKTEGFTGQVNTNMVLTANLVGLQLGYQFVLWNRVSIDMILMGPGAWFFDLKTSFDTNLPPEDEALLLEKLNGMIQDKFPGSDLVITGGGFEAKRNTSTGTMGFRYMVNLGFRF